MSLPEIAKQRSECCLQCGKPIQQAKTGRPRKWCSGACRERVRRDKERYKQARRREREDITPKELDKEVRDLKREFPRMSPETAAQLRLGGWAHRCVVCGTPFIKTQEHEVYCSAACRTAQWNEMRRREQAGLYTAPREGQTISKTTAMWLEQGRRLPFCPVCGNYLDVDPWKKGRKSRFCGKACAMRYQNLVHPVRRCKQCKKAYRQSLRNEGQKYCCKACKDAASVERRRAERGARR